jgi:4-hydroxybenzoyl-CoA thioesterase/acyl-CoA thioester hydrolase
LHRLLLESSRRFCLHWAKFADRGAASQQVSFYFSDATTAEWWRDTIRSVTHTGIRSMAQEFVKQRRVEFRDTDAAGIMHFSVFFACMEEAEHEFLRSLGLSVVQQFGQRWISWPRVHAECNYARPARFEDLLSIRLSVERIGEKSVSYRFRFWLDDEQIAEGKLIVACCEVDRHQIKAAVAVPDAFAAKIRPFVTQLSV